MPSQSSLKSKMIPPAILILAFVVTVLLFFGATYYSQKVAAHIDQAALEISQDDAPSILRLLGIRTGLLNLGSILASLMKAHPQKGEELALEANRTYEKVLIEFNSFPQLRATPAEAEAWQKLKPHVTLIGTLNKQIISDTAAGRIDAAKTIFLSNFVPEITYVSSVTAEIIEMDTMHASNLADQIAYLRRRGITNAMALDIIAGVLVLLMLFLLLRLRKQGAKILEDQSLSLKNRATALEQFSENIAHDILSPLTATSIALDAVRIKLPKSETLLHRLVSEGSSGLKRARRIVEDLLDFARAGATPTPGSASEVNTILNDLLEEVRPRIEGAGISLTTETPERESWVKCKPGILTSILSNLINNAVKYMGEAPVRKINVTVHPESQTIRIDVKDTGPGIAANFQENVFEPYFRAPDNKQRGIGLGLATVSRLVKAHEGRVGLDSTVGDGSTFWVELPRATNPGSKVK